MKLLGWKLSEDKTTEWDTSFEALGVLFEIDQTGSGVLRVRNTERRRKELTSSIAGFLDAGMMTQKEALQLRGRLQFAQAQFFGRLGRRCLKEITRHAHSRKIKAVDFLKRASGRVRQVLECWPTEVGGSSLVQDLHDSH